MPADVVVVSPGLLAAWPLRPPGTDKEQRGTVLVLGGTARTPGAVLLAGEAALRAGAGKLQLATATATAAQLGVAVPEAMVLEVPTGEEGELTVAGVDQLAGQLSRCDALLVGPGMCDATACQPPARRALELNASAFAVDAKATALLADRQGWVGGLARPCVVTVNPTELAEALGVSEQPRDLVAATAELSRREAVVVLCGGQSKIIADPDGSVWVVDNGGPGLGVSGSGDVQAGLVAGLLARGAPPAQAAVWAAYLHARAGDMLAHQVGLVGALAREISGHVPRLLAGLTAGSGSARRPPS